MFSFKISKFVSKLENEKQLVAPKIASVLTIPRGTLHMNIL